MLRLLRRQRQDICAQGRTVLPVAVVLLLAVSWYWAFKKAYWYLQSNHPAYLALAALILLGPALLAWRETYDETSPAFRILLRSSAAILGFYAAVGYDTFPRTLDGTSMALVYALGILRPVAVLAGIIAFSRPVFAIVPALYVLIDKDWTKYIFRLVEISRTDYLPVVEVAIFMTLCLVVPRIASPLLRGHNHLLPGRQRVTLMAFLAAVGIHFGNYFYSGLEKILLDGGCLSWVLRNKTHVLLMNTVLTGHLPLGAWPDLTSQVFSAMAAAVVLLNIATLAGQLYSVIAIRNVRQIIAITLFYDVTHIVIFAVTGIFFWKWILLNLAIVGAASTIRGEKLVAAERLLGSAFVVGGTLVFFAARLAWYDTPAVNKTYFVAVTKAGDEYEVPSNYFGAASIAVAQMDLPVIVSERFPTGTWGATTSWRIKSNAERCDFSPTELRTVRLDEPERVRDFIRKVHSAVIERANSRGIVTYDLYPHHIWSNPLLYLDFYRLDKRTIVAYKYVTESVCLDFVDGRVERRIVASYQLRVDV